MIEKPVAYIKPNVDGKLITITKEHLDACKDGWAYIKFEWEKAEPLFTESQLKAERERAVSECIKIGLKYCYGEQYESMLVEQMLKLLDN
jgi:hypothetical protein